MDTDNTRAWRCGSNAWSYRRTYGGGCQDRHARFPAPLSVQCSERPLGGSGSYTPFSFPSLMLPAPAKGASSCLLILPRHRIGGRPPPRPISAQSSSRWRASASSATVSCSSSATSLASLNLGLPLSTSVGPPSRFRPLAPISSITSVTSRWLWPPLLSPSGWRSSPSPGKGFGPGSAGPSGPHSLPRDRGWTGPAFALRLWPRHAGPSRAHLPGCGHSPRRDLAGAPGPRSLTAVSGRWAGRGATVEEASQGLPPGGWGLGGAVCPPAGRRSLNTEPLGSR